MKIALPSLLPAALAGAFAPAAFASTCPDLNALQRAAGFVTWQNVLQLAAIGLAAAGTLFFASGLLRQLLHRLRVVEAALWAATLAALAGGALVPPQHRLWPVLFGSLLLPGAAALSAFVRQLRIAPRHAWTALAVAWSTLALAYQKPAVGFLAVGAWLALAGLMIGVLPRAYVFGFRDADALVRGTLAGAALALAYGAAAATGTDLGRLEVFRAGAFWLGGLAWHLGVLILASRWYRPAGGHYLARQLLAVVSLAGPLALGLLFGLREASTLATAFLLFYLSAKVIEVPVRGRIGFGLKLLAAGGLLAAAWYGSLLARPWLAAHLAWPA